MQDSVGGPRLWLLQGKTAGDNAQVLALGENLTAGAGWQAEIKTLSPDLRQAAKRRWSKRPALDRFAASEMSPPWATTSSRFCVVWAWAGPLSAGATAAAAPSVAADFRSSRRVSSLIGHLV